MKDEIVSLRAVASERDAALNQARSDLAQVRSHAAEMQERLLSSGGRATSGSTDTEELCSGVASPRVHPIVTSCMLVDDEPLEQLHAQVRRLARQVRPTVWQQPPHVWSCNAIEWLHVAVAGYDADTSCPAHAAAVCDTQIMRSWAKLSVPYALGAAFVRHESWDSRHGCAAAVALLACLHQLHEDAPAGAAAAAALLQDEAAVLETGIAAMEPSELEAISSSVGVAGSGDRAQGLLAAGSGMQRRQLLMQLWAAAPLKGQASAEITAGASAAAVVAVLARADCADGCDVVLKGAGHWWAATSLALRDTAN
jgi:hypothetical protein